MKADNNPTGPLERSRASRFFVVVVWWSMTLLLGVPTIILIGICKAFEHLGEFIQDIWQHFRQEFSVALKIDLWAAAKLAVSQNKQAQLTNRLLREEIEELKSALANNPDDTLPGDLRRLWVSLQAEMPGVEIERSPGTIGFWAREAGHVRPDKHPEAAAGWDERDLEIKEGV
jgi:hypothetical protein